MKFVPEQKILYLKQLTVGRIFPLSMPLLIVSKMHLTKANLCAGFFIDLKKAFDTFFYSSITHFRTKNLATLGINQQKYALKSIRYRNNDWNII